MGAGLAGLLGVTVWTLAFSQSSLLDHDLAHAAVFLLITVAHGGVRLGRKVYLVDMATQRDRAAMVAVSNTVIGVAMLAGGSVGILADLLGPEDVILSLGVMSLAAAVYGLRLKDVSG